MTLKPEHDRLTRMLVVDDHTICGQHALAALRQCPGEVLWVKSASAAVETALCWRPHIIFMDRHLPDSDGLELLDRIRAEWPGDRALPKFVVMTGDASTLATAAIDATQVDLVLVKPVSGREIRVAAGLAVSNEIKESDAAGTGGELRAMFRRELEQRLPELDSSLGTLNSKAAADILHQLIASAAICLESRLESSLRSLDAACRQGAQAGELARRYHVMLEYARAFMAKTAP